LGYTSPRWQIRRERATKTPLSIATQMIGGSTSLTLAQARSAGKTALLLPQNVRLPEGKLLSTIIEVFTPSEPRQHPGEEFVFVLEGNAQITVGKEIFLLEQGESIVFRSAEPHAYAPNPNIPTHSLPVRLLSVRLDDRPSKK
jgi:mannose-6-phosphate isomerase-like protein (cupin superfamily)